MTGLVCPSCGVGLGKEAVRPGQELSCPLCGKPVPIPPDTPQVPFKELETRSLGAAGGWDTAVPGPEKPGGSPSSQTETFIPGITTSSVLAQFDFLEPPTAPGELGRLA